MYPVPGSEPAREGGLIADLSLSGVHIHFCGNGCLWFRPYGDSLWQTPQRKQRSSPQRPAPRLGSAFPRSGIHLGASPPVGFASTSSRCVRLRRTALRAHPQMNASTRPPEGAGRSRSKAGELTLGLMSGEKRSMYTEPLVGARLAREGGLTADQSLAGTHIPLWELACPRRRPDSRPTFCGYTQSNCGSWPASEGGLPADQHFADTPNPIVGAGLPAKAACQPTNISQMHPIQL
ncbi:hypothetical protein OKW12_001393 [Pseudomonas silensiensis]|nr:hypothetical protein [Pseudomonas silensiensis]